jgi:hypothetical protein
VKWLLCKLLGIHTYEWRPKESKTFMFCKHCGLWTFGKWPGPFIDKSNSDLINKDANYDLPQNQTRRTARAEIERLQSNWLTEHDMVRLKNVELTTLAKELRDALSTCRGQWIHSVNKEQALVVLTKADSILGG